MKYMLLTFLGLGFSLCTYAQMSADSALVLLKAGNERFYKGESVRPNQSPERV